MATFAMTLLGLVLIAALVAAFYFLDRLIQYEYRFHRDAWEGDGRPIGYLFRPAEATWFRSGFALSRCSLAWLFHTPAWADEDVGAASLLSRWRWCVLIWNVGFVIFLLLVLIHVAGSSASNQALELTAGRCTEKAES
jgi:hypothetical protein